MKAIVYSLMIASLFVFSGCESDPVQTGDGSSSGGITLPTSSNKANLVPGETGGFLWKPISESNSKLVVLLPQSYNDGKVQLCYVLDSGNNIVETGVYSGDHNGDRPHYRFSKPGAQFGNNVTVIAEIAATGAKHYWNVPVGANRTEL